MILLHIGNENGFLKDLLFESKKSGDYQTEMNEDMFINNWFKNIEFLPENSVFVMDYMPFQC